MTIVQNSETNAMEIQTFNSSKECANWGEWQSAFQVFMAVYVTTHLDKVLDLLKYKKMIQDASRSFKWDSVLPYDYQFCQYIVEYPTMSWGIKNAELYLECFNGYIALPPKVPKNFSTGNHPKGSGTLICNNFNKGLCTWGKSCKFEHKCFKCKSMGHPTTKCHQHKQEKDKQKDKSDK